MRGRVAPDVVWDVTEDVWGGLVGGGEAWEAFALEPQEFIEVDHTAFAAV